MEQLYICYITLPSYRIAKLDKELVFYGLFCAGVIRYKGAKIQLLDLPGIIEGAKDGKGRGRQVIAGIYMFCCDME